MSPETTAAEQSHRWSPEAPRSMAQRLGISLEAAELFSASDVVDLHVDSFIWTRTFGYRIDQRHSPGWLGARFFRQVDLPRLRQIDLGSATWVITTNPWRSARGRRRALARNLERLEALLRAHPNDVAIVRDVGDFRRARAAGLHAAFLGIQGGNAADADPEALALLSPQRVLRVTLLHLSSSRLGTTSAPSLHAPRPGLTPAGRDAVRWLNHERIFVDLAHISPEGFWAALDAHDPSLPPIVTHTGVAACHRHWRNLDDAQIRAVAERGGVIGIMFHTPFLQPGLRRGTSSAIIEHLEHVLRVGGEHCAALGSDWDGAIITPRDMPTCLELPRLVQQMLERKWSPQRIQNVLGANFLRTLADLRG